MKARPPAPLQPSVYLFHLFQGPGGVQGLLEPGTAGGDEGVVSPPGMLRAGGGDGAGKWGLGPQESDKERGIWGLARRQPMWMAPESLLWAILNNGAKRLPG